MNPAYKPMLATLVEEPFDDKTWVFGTNIVAETNLLNAGTGWQSVNGHPFATG